MAGGIDWFRWHHGSVTDPKFQLVARKSGASLPAVLAVWAYLLEKASAAEFRGCFGEIDCEAVDCLFGLDEGQTELILGAMTDRKLIADEYVVAWEKRQAKREDATAAERKRSQRQRERESKTSTDAVTQTQSRDVTQSHAEVTQCPSVVTQCHDREEKSREEKKETSEANASGAAAPLQHVDNFSLPGLEQMPAAPPPTDRDAVFANGVVLLTSAGVAEKHARSFLAVQCKTYGELAVRQDLERCADQQPIQPVPWIQADLAKTGKGKKAGRHTGFEDINYREGIAADGSLI
jgi:hypothetical protein